MVFCNTNYYNQTIFHNKVTILILIDGFLQFKKLTLTEKRELSHNPYFNRWFSAICTTMLIWAVYVNVTILILIDGFLQLKTEEYLNGSEIVTILILIDGFLQLITIKLILMTLRGHNPYFNRWFSAMKLMPIVTSQKAMSQSLF